MKRVRCNYHALHVLKTAEPRLHKALITNCKKELVNCISEFLFNVLNGNIKFSVCKRRKLQEHKAALRKVADRYVSISSKKRLRVQSEGNLLPLLGAILPTIAILIFRGNMLCEI